MPKARLTEGAVAPMLVRLALPMIAASLGLILFNLTDAYFIGRLGARQLAAMGFTFPVALIVGSISAGIGIGASSSLSRALGANDTTLAQALCTHAHWLALLLSAVLSALGLAVLHPLFQLLGAESEVFPYIRRYMVIWLLGLPSVIVPMTGSSVIQATGDTRTPGLLMFGAVMLNILLDWLLIFGNGPFPRMGMAGAAIATVVARASVLLVIIPVLAIKLRLLAFGAGAFTGLARSWRIILHTGIPAAAANIMQPLSMAVITRLVASFGMLAVAGFGIAARIESFALIFIMALSLVITPFAGQNFGARKIDRIRQGVGYAITLSLLWGMVVLVVFFVFARPAALIFTDSGEVAGVAGSYLAIMALSYGFQGVVLISGAALNGMHRPLTAATLAGIRLFVCYVPIAYAGSSLYGVTGLFGGAAIGNVLAGALALVYWRMTIRDARSAYRAGS